MINKQTSAKRARDKQQQLQEGITGKLKLSKEWNTVLEKYRPNRVIGKGGSGIVVRAKDQWSNTVAIKFMKTGFQDGYHYSIKRVLSEIQVLRHLTQMKENVHTIKLLDLIVSEDLENVFLVTNYVPNDLDNILRKSPDQVDEELTIKILFKLLCCLNFIHKANVMHRDIKPQNILVDGELNLQLCDFGLARTSRKVEQAAKDYCRETMSKKLNEIRHLKLSKKRELSNHVMTRQYRAPEVIIMEKRYKQSVDLWSTGCVLAEMVSCGDVNHQPFFNGNSCEPLSPRKTHHQSGKDQMEEILKFTGGLDEADVSFITEPSVAEEFLKHKISKQNALPDTKVTTIIKNLLEFNPYFRKRPEQLINLKIFDKLRDENPELLEQPPRQIILEMDQKHAFDYERSKFTKLTMDDLKNMLLNEVQLIQESNYG